MRTWRVRLRGKNQALAIGNVNDFQVKDQRMAATFESLYGVSPIRC